MFQRMLKAFGVGGPTVDTVLDNPNVMPGHMVSGQVRIMGGTSPAQIDAVVLSLVTRIEIESGDSEFSGTQEFGRFEVQRFVQVPAGQLVSIPFQVPLHYETPITMFGPSPLRGMSVGLRTELVISGAPDPGDLDPLMVQPLPSQARVLDALGRMGFHFRSADCEAGRVYGVPQQLPFYQEIEYYPAAQVAHGVSQIELTFVTTPHELHVVLEADKRGGLLQSGGDVFGRFSMTHQQAESADWTTVIGPWIEQVASRRGFGGHGGYGQPHGGYGHHGHHGHGGDMGGVGGAVLGGAAGFLGGMIAGEMLEEIFDDD